MYELNGSYKLWDEMKRRCVDHQFTGLHSENGQIGGKMSVSTIGTQGVIFSEES